MAEGELIESGTAQLVAGTRRSNQNPAVVYLARLSLGSRPAMARALDMIAQIVTDDEEADRNDVPWHAIRCQHTEAIRSVLAERYAHSTANKMLSALRQTLKAAWKLGLMSAEEYHQAASVESVNGETVPAGRVVAGGELVALLDTCDQKPVGIRDAAVLSLLYSAGLRRAEVVGLNVGDYDPAGQQILVRGKRNKQRSLPIVAGATAPARTSSRCRSSQATPMLRPLLGMTVGASRLNVRRSACCTSPVAGGCSGRKRGANKAAPAGDYGLSRRCMAFCCVVPEISRHESTIAPHSAFQCAFW